MGARGHFSLGSVNNLCQNGLNSALKGFGSGRYSQILCGQIDTAYCTDALVPVLMQWYLSQPEMSLTLNLAGRVHLPYSFCRDLQARAMAQRQAAPPPPSPLVSRAFPFLMMCKVQPLSFTSPEDSRDCKEYDEVKWYSVGLNTVILKYF